MDYMPTLLDIIDVSIPSDVALDGESVWPQLSGKEKHRQKPIVFCSARQAAVVEGGFKLYYTKGKYELYNLVEDPSERKDISALYPEQVEKLKQYMVEKIEDYRVSFEKGKKGASYYWQEWWNVWE